MHQHTFTTCMALPNTSWRALMQAMSGARLVELMGPTGEPANVVVFVFACGLMMLNLTQLRMAFDMDVSKSTTHNQMAAYKVAHPSDWPDTYATKQQRAFCKAHKIPGTARTSVLKLVKLDDFIGFCEAQAPTWGFLLPQLRLLNVARPASVTPATLTLSPEHLQASHLATAPVHLQETMVTETYSSEDLTGQYGLASVRPRWTIPQLNEFMSFLTTAFHFRREGQAVSETTARHFGGNIGSYIGFCVTYRNVTVLPSLLVCMLCTRAQPSCMYEAHACLNTHACVCRRPMQTLPTSWHTWISFVKGTCCAPP